MPENHLLQLAIQAAKNGKRQQAYQLLKRALAEDPGSSTAWAWLIDLSPDRSEQIRACREFLKAHPDNQRVHARLAELAAAENQSAAQSAAAGQQKKRARHRREFDQADQEHFRENPFDLAAYHEEQGQYEKAIEAYRAAADQARSTQDWDKIFHNIRRLETHIDSGVRHVSPRLNIARMALGPALVYILLMLLNAGLNPLRAPALAWLGIPLVLLGGYLVALAHVRSRSRVWKKLFGEPGAGGSGLARFTVGLTGWFLVVLPFLVILSESIARLRIFDPSEIIEMIL